MNKLERFVLLNELKKSSIRDIFPPLDVDIFQNEKHCIDHWSKDDCINHLWIREYCSNNNELKRNSNYNSLKEYIFSFKNMYSNNRYINEYFVLFNMKDNTTRVYIKTKIFYLNSYYQLKNLKIKPGSHINFNIMQSIEYFIHLKKDGQTF